MESFEQLGEKYLILLYFYEEFLRKYKTFLRLSGYACDITTAPFFSEFYTAIPHENRTAGCKRARIRHTFGPGAEIIRLFFFVLFDH